MVVAGSSVACGVANWQPMKIRQNTIVMNQSCLTPLYFNDADIWLSLLTERGDFRVHFGVGVERFRVPGDTPFMPIDP
jgi:hypothetical protein